ncbi:hypothetical protein DRO53_05275 [Candidatus Bathyarchaeota archaeon]|nr:MAG: hypothetical protein DRO46_03405 [Candidatus Hecatellales archaeon]RLI33490.1 MAG: hypothetical protein DRO53_05275 [Candidatus Bathyarchaeota archaeon]
MTTIPKTLVEKFYRSTFNRNFAEAERLLGRIRRRLPKGEWGVGFSTALEGIMTAYKTKDDKYVFVNRLPKEKGEALRLAEEFKGKVERQVSSEFDKGYFSAWEFLVRLIASGKLKPPS